MTRLKEIAARIAAIDVLIVAYEPKRLCRVYVQSGGDWDHKTVVAEHLPVGEAQRRCAALQAEHMAARPETTSWTADLYFYEWENPAEERDLIHERRRLYAELLTAKVG